MKKCVALLLIIVSTILAGCSSDDYKVNNHNNGKKADNKSNISYETVVCEYTVRPNCWTVVDCISTNVKVYADNTVEVYCSNFYDNIRPDEELSIEYIYGETYEITEEQKQEIVDMLEKNKRKLFAKEREDDICDGDSSYIILFDENGEKVHWCSGLNAYGEVFRLTKEKIFSVLPEKTVENVRDKATEILIDYLLENYPERYDWLAEERGR